MKKFICVCLPLCFLLYAAACQSRAGDGKLVEQPPSSSAPAFSPIEPTAALIKDLSDACLTQSFSSFIHSHPDFLYEAVPRYSFHTGTGIDDGGLFPELLLSGDSFAKDAFSSADVLFNHSRLSSFYQHYHEGIADSICILSPGDPIPLWMTIYTFDGTALTRSRYACGLNDNFMLDVKEVSLHVQNEGFSETDTEWILTDENELKIRFPKFGFAPRQISQETLRETLLEGFDGSYQVSNTDQTVLLGRICQVYDILDQNGAQISSFAVAQDFSRFYQIEHANGQWLLQARLLGS